MPPEMLRDGISTEKSDVVSGNSVHSYTYSIIIHIFQWAFGITCWEVFSLGLTPYPGVENHEMLELLCNGLRLKKPSLCPVEM